MWAAHMARCPSARPGVQRSRAEKPEGDHPGCTSGFARGSSGIPAFPASALPLTDVRGRRPLVSGSAIDILCMALGERFGSRAHRAFSGTRRRVAAVPTSLGTSEHSGGGASLLSGQRPEFPEDRSRYDYTVGTVGPLRDFYQQCVWGRFLTTCGWTSTSLLLVRGRAAQGVKNIMSTVPAMPPFMVAVAPYTVEAELSE